MCKVFTWLSCVCDQTLSTQVEILGYVWCTFVSETGKDLEAGIEQWMMVELYKGVNER